MAKVLLLAALLGMSGCSVPSAVVVEKGHVHTDQCGHYQDRGGWYQAPGHVHRAGCGHVFRGGFWVAMD